MSCGEFISTSSLGGLGWFLVPFMSLSCLCVFPSASPCKVSLVSMCFGQSVSSVMSLVKSGWSGLKSRIAADGLQVRLGQRWWPTLPNTGQKDQKHNTSLDHDVNVLGVTKIALKRILSQL